VTTSIYCLRPDVAARADELLRYLDKAGKRHKVTSTRRTTEEQIALWCQGRAPLEIVNLLRQHAGLPKILPSENTYTVTACDGINKTSAHQEGRALDIAVLTLEGQPSWDYARFALEYRTIGEIARQQGWICGMDWPPINPRTGLGADPPHYEVAV